MRYFGRLAALALLMGASSFAPALADQGFGSDGFAPHEWAPPPPKFSASMERTSEHAPAMRSKHHTVSATTIAASSEQVHQAQRKHGAHARPR